MKRTFVSTMKFFSLLMVAFAAFVVACTPTPTPEPEPEPGPGPGPGPGPEVVIPDISEIDPNEAWPLISTIPSFVSPDTTSDVVVVVNVADSAVEEGEELYAHTGVITDASTGGGDWKHVKYEWTVNSPDCKLTHVGGTIYAMAIAGGPKAFYGVGDEEELLQMAFVFRNADGTKEVKNNGQDIYIDLVAADALVVKVLSPAHGSIFPIGAEVDVVAVSQNAKTLQLTLNGSEVKSVEANKIAYTHTVATGGDMNFEAVATAEDGSIAKDAVTAAALKGTEEKSRPAGVKDGVTIDGTEATFVLFAPGKEQIVLLGEFNKFAPSNDYVMYKDGDYFWTTVSGLKADTEYAYQYLVDGKVKVGDPYSEKILDPWNDKWIDATVYPNLKEYPTQTTEIVSVFTTSTADYNWQVTNFERPDKNSLAIYELLFRDFTPEGSVKAATAKLDYLAELGINAIELMPIQEFDGNNSWGYNPCFYFAPDKAYGTEEDYKEFIDECHKRGIAVILDIVLNHATGQFPWMRMWSDDGSYPNAQNPFFNVTAKHPFNVYNDINHDFHKTRSYFSDMLKFWLTEYKVDGYRFDLAKGITQTNSGEDDGRCRNYDSNRIGHLKYYYDAMQEASAGSYMILEYFVCDQEENEMAAYGALPWRNSISGYQETVMGWTGSNKSYFGSAYASGRVSYMESHDEERVAYKALAYGGAGVKDWANLSNRLAASFAFHFLTPYPKMMWQGGEFGDDRELTEEGRTDPKPFRWEDMNDPNRKALYDAASKIISFRTGHPELYGDGATNRLTTYNVNDADMGGKHMVYTSGNSTVLVAANFLTEGENPSTPGGGGGTTTVGGSLIYTSPSVVGVNTTEDVIVYLNLANSAMKGFSGDLYAHTGVITNKSADDSDWKYVKHEWTVNADDCKLTNQGGDLWSLTIKGGPRAFYGVPSGETIQKMAFVFRNADGSKEVKDNGADIFVPLSTITIYTEPATVYNNTTTDVELFVDTTGTNMDGFSGDMYAHTGVLTDKSASSSDWKYVKHEWTVNADDCKLTKVEGNLWKLTIKGGPRAFYGVSASETIKKMAFVFRNSDGSKELKDNGNDIFVEVQGNQPAKVMAKAPTQFAIAVPNGTYTNLITEEEVVINGGLYNVSLEPHSYVVLVKTN